MAECVGTLNLDRYASTASLLPTTQISKELYCHDELCNNKPAHLRVCGLRELEWQDLYL